MNRELNEIRKILNRRLADASRTTLYGKVESVDREQRTCRILVGEVYYEDVLLYSVVNPIKKGRTVFPTVGSTVLATRVDGSERLFVSMFSEVDSIEVTFDDSHILTFDIDGMELQQGEGLTARITDVGITIEGSKGESEEEGGEDVPKKVEVTIDEIKLTTGGTLVTLDDKECYVNCNGTEVTIDENGCFIHTNDTDMSVSGDGCSIETGGTTIDLDSRGLTASDSGGFSFKAGTSGYGFTRNGVELLGLLGQLCQQLQLLQVTTAMGPSGFPINGPQIKLIADQIDLLTE